MYGGTGRRGAGRALGGVLLLIACAGDLVAMDGGFLHRRHGYVIGTPGPPWVPAEVEDAVIAYRRPGPATMSLQSRCKGAVAEPAIMARHLRIGLPPHTLRQAGPLALAGHSAWSQTLDTLDGGVAVRLKTVTLVAGGCTLDWVLVSPRVFEEAEPDFDRWVESVRLPEAPVRAGGSG